jgi:hypothetical protein
MRATVVSEVTVHYNPNSGRLEQLAYMWEELHRLACSTVQSYHSDLYHDAVWIHQYLQEAKERTFWYGVGKTGTTIFDREKTALACRVHGRPLVYRCTLKPDEQCEQVWHFVIEQLDTTTTTEGN